MGSPQPPLPLAAAPSCSSFAPLSISPICYSSTSLKYSATADAARSLNKRTSNNNGGRCVSVLLSHSSTFKTLLRLRSIQHRGGETVKASISGFTSPDGGDEVVDKMLEGSDVETSSPGTAFLAKLAIALGIAATITLISVRAKWSPSGSSYSLPVLIGSTSHSVPVAPPVGFNLTFFGYNIIIPEYTPGWVYFWLLMAAGCGLFISEEALSVWVGISLARTLTLDSNWQAFTASFSKNAPYIVSTVLWVYWGVCISDMIPYYLGRIFRKTKASEDICTKFGIGKDKAERITEAVQKYGNLIGFDCIWRSETVEEFDYKWTELIEKSGLHENNWLQSMFEIRSKWVPAHVNHVFSAEMSSSQRAESAHAFFKRFVSKKNSLVDFMIQFGRGLVRQRQEELFADHKDMSEKPKVKMLHDFLTHMIDIYTREVFYKFQDEMWSSLTYKFQLLHEDDTHKVYQIRRKNVENSKVREICYDKHLDFAKCTCKMFECSGVPCRHVLAYLHIYFNDLEKLPNHYILRRWTKTAKSAQVIDSCGIEITDDKSYLLKRSRLIQFSLDVVDKALISEEATKVYTDALGSALQKINEMVGSDPNVVVPAARSSQMVGYGRSGNVSGNMSCNQEHIYNEPRQARAKGCGKRFKGGKEKALGRAKNAKVRRCHGCGLVGQSHDKRNCPKLVNTSLGPSEYATPDESCDESNSSTVERFSLGVRNPTAFMAGAWGISSDCFFAGVCCGGLITLSIQLAIGFLLREQPAMALAGVATVVGIWTVFPYLFAALTAMYLFIRRRQPNQP